jgi:hypothetical protein
LLVSTDDIHPESAIIDMFNDYANWPKYIVVFGGFHDQADNVEKYDITIYELLNNKIHLVGSHPAIRSGGSCTQGTERTGDFLRFRLLSIPHPPDWGIHPKGRWLP